MFMSIFHVCFALLRYKLAIFAQFPSLLFSLPLSLSLVFFSFSQGLNELSDGQDPALVYY